VKVPVGPTNCQALTGGVPTTTFCTTIVPGSSITFSAALLLLLAGVMSLLAVMVAVLVICVPISALLSLTTAVMVMTPPSPTARSLTAQAKSGAPLVWVMATPLPTVLLVMPLTVMLTGTLSLITTCSATPGPALLNEMTYVMDRPGACDVGVTDLAIPTSAAMAKAVQIV
jgi:hypothetical protein